MSLLGSIQKRHFLNQCPTKKYVSLEDLLNELKFLGLAEVCAEHVCGEFFVFTRQSEMKSKWKIGFTPLANEGFIT